MSCPISSRFPGLDPLPSPAAWLEGLGTSLILGLPILPQPLHASAAPSPPPALLLQAILSFTKHLPGISLSPRAPHLPPPCSTGAIPGQPPHHGRWPSFYFLVLSALGDLRSGGDACCCLCPVPQRQRSQKLALSLAKDGACLQHLFSVLCL